MRTPYPIRPADQSDQVARALSRPRRGPKTSPRAAPAPAPPSPEQLDQVSRRILRRLTPKEAD